LGQMPRLARIPRRARTPEHTLPPPLRRVPVPILFSPNSSRCQLEAPCLTTAPSAQMSRLQGNPRRRYHRPRSPQLRLRPQRNCSDPTQAAKSMRKDTRTQRPFLVTELKQRLREPTYLLTHKLVQAAKRSPNIGFPLLDCSLVASS